MRHVEIDMKKIIVDRIKEELGDDGQILRVIPVSVYESYVMAEDRIGYRLYKIATDFPNIQEIDGRELEDPFDDFQIDKKSGARL